MGTIGPIPLNKGWMTDADPFSCPQGGALTFYGFEPWGNGSVKTLDSPSSGFSLSQLTGGVAPMGFTMWQDPAQLNVQNPIIVTAGTAAQKIYTSIGLSFASWTDRTGGTTVAASGIYTFDVLNGKLLLFNSDQSSSFNVAPLVITTYNGNAALLGGTPPKGNIVKVCNNFAFVSQVLASASTQSTVYWSAASDPTTWPAGSNLTFRQGDGDYITALSAIGSNLFIFKSKSIGILNTTTTTVSGTVTLGPLYTFTDRVGCVGHQALDTMPDGTIVFLGLDRNIYQTDGTTLVNLSGNPAPSSNINPGVNFPIGTFAPPIYSASSFPFASLRVDPMFHRILVMMYAFSGVVNKVYMFDYISKVWADWTELDNDTATGNYGYINCMSVMPQQMANGTGLGNAVWLGWSNGYLTNFSPYGFLQHFSVATQWNNILETSIQLGSSSPPEFIPRTVLIPISFPNSSGTVAGIIKVRIGFDGVYASTDAYTSGNITVPPNNLMVKVPVGELVRSGQTFIHPRTMQIKITLTGNVVLDQMIIEPIYISDEVLQ